MTTCDYCEEEVLPEEVTEARLNMKPVHAECHFRAIMGSAAHQLHECSCFGGTREDPPGMSRRESAKLALETYRMITEAE